LKAIAISDYGLENAALVDVPDPAAGPGEIAVAVRAAGLNRLDLWTASGSLPIEHEFPHVLGADAAGEVVELGEGVRAPAPGTKVVVNPGISCGACEFCRSGEQSICTSFRMLGEHLRGTLAERVVVPAGNAFPFPSHLSFPGAAALGTTFITAYRMLFTRGRLTPGEWALITGIGGGLALSLFQLARPTAGKIFVTSSSSEKIARAVKLGADNGIDYSAEDVGRAIRKLTNKRGVDIVLDSASGPTADSLLRSLRKGGRLVIAGATAGPSGEIGWQRVFWNQLEIIGSTMGSVLDVSNMLRMVAGSRIEPIVDSTFSLEDGVAALTRLDSGEQFGKVIVEIP
jgi:NADPH:quinone reductase-like Zn-dependent oxidoreductase